MIYTPFSPTVYGEKTQRLMPLNCLHVPQSDTTDLNTVETTVPQLRSVGGVLYYYDGTSWSPLTIGASNEGDITWAVISTSNAPPVSPQVGDYRVGIAGSGLWATHNNQIAHYSGSLPYTYDTATTGDLLLDANTGYISRWTGTTWIQTGTALLHQGGDKYKTSVRVGTKDNYGLGLVTNSVMKASYAADGTYNHFDTVGGLKTSRQYWDSGTGYYTWDLGERDTLGNAANLTIGNNQAGGGYGTLKLNFGAVLLQHTGNFQVAGFTALTGANIVYDGIYFTESTGGWSGNPLGLGTPFIKAGTSNANTAGGGILLYAGNANSVLTGDLNGGASVISGGSSTGTGTSEVWFYTASPSVSGTASNTPTKKVIVTGNGDMRYMADYSTSYSSRSLIDKGYADANYSGGGGGSQSLQDVTDIGATTNHSIAVAGLYINDGSHGDAGYIGLQSDKFRFQDYLLSPIFTVDKNDAVLQVYNRTASRFGWTLSGADLTADVLFKVPNTGATRVLPLSVNSVFADTNGSISITTSDIAEGSNKYYTSTAFNSSFAAKTTNDLAENTNLYFTTARVLATTLAGLSISGSSISSSDTVLGAFGKLQNQVTGLLGGATYQGTWAASTNTPTLANGTGTKGYYYVASNNGTVNFGTGGIDFAVGDWAIYNGTIWQKVDNTDAVSDVNGSIGSISLTGTANRITVTGNVWDISSTFEGLLGKVASPLSQFASTTSSQLAGVISDETGSGALVFATSPTLVTPILGTPTSGNLTNCTFPTLNQNTTGSAAKWTTARAIYGNNIDGSANITSAIIGTYGGTGVNNGFKTLTLSGNTVLGSNTDTLTFNTSANTSVTLPTTGTLAVVPNSGSGTYSLTPSWSGAAPTTPTLTYYWVQDPQTKFTSLTISGIYANPGTTNTQLTCVFPAGCPLPSNPTGFTNVVNDKVGDGYGFVDASINGFSPAVRVQIMKATTGTSANTDYMIASSFGSQSSKVFQLTVTFISQ